MMLHTVSGLHGALIEFVSTAIDHSRDGFDGYAIVQRRNPAFEQRAYSTHRLYTEPDGQGGYYQCAEMGHYDLTLELARKDLRDRVGPRPTPEG